MNLVNGPSFPVPMYLNWKFFMVCILCWSEMIFTLLIFLSYETIQIQTTWMLQSILPESNIRYRLKRQMIGFQLWEILDCTAVIVCIWLAWYSSLKNINQRPQWSIEKLFSENRPVMAQYSIFCTRLHQRKSTANTVALPHHSEIYCSLPLTTTCMFPFTSLEELWR